ncbi:protein unc-45 homolog B-like [Haliotis rufescens]|uniref:protein unc-45 homolog B-like n=1 Tax=Haliotis rufescens TaxID=6454 RepID=UPI00201EDAD3|nr:protein unc-45 homolog B-like [Haliotis rufescens]
MQLLEMADSKTLKEEGNQLFKDGNIDKALACYTQALELGPLKEAEKSVLHKNRAACFLKKEQYEKVIDEATKSLDLTPNDPKALFRRCQAYEKLDKLDEAFRDAAIVMKIDPKNTAVMPIFKRLNPIVQERTKARNSTVSKVTQMFNFAFDQTVELEKRKQALNNLIVLAREETGSELICRENGIRKLMAVLEEAQLEVVQAAIRVLSLLSKDSMKRSKAIVDIVTVPKILRMLGSPQAEVSDSSSVLIGNVITYYTGVDKYREEVKKYEADRKKGERVRYPHFKVEEDDESFVDQVFLLLINMVGNGKVSAVGRDNAIELLIKHVTWKEGVNWTNKFLKHDGVEKLLTVAGTVKEYHTLPVTENTRMHASVALSKIYDDLSSDQLRNTFKDQCTDFFKDLFSEEDMESKVEAIEGISTLLQGPFEVGNLILGTQGVTQIMFALANSESRLHQRVAVEAIVNSASKKERCSGILKDAVPILKGLYQSADDHIRVRALVGLCKLGSFHGSDASAKPMADGSSLSLAKSCRKFLTNPAKDVDLRKWATEGLAYLTLDGDVKEELIDDVEAIKSIFEIAKVKEKNVAYAAITIMVNLTNSYDKQDIMPELIELAKFSKQHVPEEHEKDKMEFIQSRIQKLAKAGAVNALVALSTTESKNSKELIARVFMSIATEENLRGLIVQQGGAKVLLPLSLQSTDIGEVLAAHALAKIAVTMNPEVAFPGQRMYEIVRPLISLLQVERSGLQNFEALMALTNLASVSDSVRNRIVSEKGIPAIDNYMYEEHEMLRRAATQCMCNLVMNEKVIKLYEGENDRVKLMVLFCGEEDPELRLAAAGAIAMISSLPSIAKKIIEVKGWYEIIQGLAVEEEIQLQHRGCHILKNMMVDRDTAEKIVASQDFEVLMAITMLKDPQREAATKCAKEALDLAEEHGLIKPKASVETLEEEEED